MQQQNVANDRDCERGNAEYSWGRKVACFIFHWRYFIFEFCCNFLKANCLRRVSSPAILIFGVPADIFGELQYRFPETVKMGVTVDDIIQTPFSGRTFEDKMKIVAGGKPRPSLNMAAAITMNAEQNELCTYQFRPSLYDEVHWLTGCEKRNSFFCWPCVLFLPTGGVWTTTGVTDVVYFFEGKSEHEESPEHKQSVLKLQDLVEHNNSKAPIDIAGHNDVVKRNRAILKRMIDVVCNLLTKEKSFYDRINGCELDPENCAKNLKFLRLYDVLNVNYIEDAVELIQISPGIVNDLVNTISLDMKVAIKKEVLQSTYVSIILNDHSKIAESAQISTVLRYIKGGKVCERFVGFTNMGNRKSMSNVYEHISNVVKEFSLSEKLLALALDGSILQTDDMITMTSTMKNLYPFAFFVPWYGHSLDYVLQQSLASMKKCSTFFKVINEMKAFFQKKSKPFKALEAFMATGVPSTQDTKWFVRSQLIQVLHKYRKFFQLFFDSMLQGSTMYEPEEVAKALGFLGILGHFHTQFLLITFSKLFDHIAPLIKILKSSVPEKIFNRREALGFTASLVAARETEFNDVWSELHSENYTEKPGPASKKIKIDMDDPKVEEYHELYKSIINRMIQEIENRISNLGHLSFCQLLYCDKSGKFVFSNEMVQDLMLAHGTFFDEEQIRNELIVLRTNGTVFAKKNVYEMLEFFIQAKLKETFKYVCKLAEFILTLPIKPPTEEEGTTKLRELKDWSYIPDARGVPNPGDVSIPCVELEFLHELKKSPTFHDEISAIFYEQNKTFELLYK